MKAVWVGDDLTDIYIITEEYLDYHILVKNKTYKTLTFVENFAISEEELNDMDVYMLKKQIREYSSEKIVNRLNILSNYFNILAHDKQIKLTL